MLGASRYRIRLLANPEGVHLFLLRNAVRQALLHWNDQQFRVALDYGCGDCPYEEETRSVATQLFRADIGVNPLADVLVGVSDTLPFEDESMDLITSFQVLEHVADYRAYLSECARLSGEGGCLLLTVPSIWPYHPHPTDYRRWLVQGLTWDLAEVGYEVEKHVYVLNPISASVQYTMSVFDYMSIGRGRFFRFFVRGAAILANIAILLSERLFRRTSRLGGGNILVLCRRTTRGGGE